MRYKAVLLDFYGTLVEEDEPFLLQIVERIAACSPLSHSPAEIARDWWALMGAMVRAAHGPDFLPQRELEINSLRQLLRDYQVDLDADALSEALFAYWQSPRPYPGAGDFLQQLNVPVCVVSNIDEDDVRSAIRLHGWDLPLVVTSETCRAYKPRPEMFATALNLLGASPQDVLHVGDSLDADVAGAQRFGIDVGWLNRRNRPIPPNPPTYVATGFDDLLRQIQPASA